MDTQPSWHPDGVRLVHTHHPQNDQELVNGAAQIWTRSIDSVGTFLTVGSEPAYSPDGALLAFARGGDVIVRNMASKAEQQVTFLASCHSPAWSPDGGSLVYSVLENPPAVPTDSAGLWTLNLSPSLRRQLVRGSAFTPRWSPDGARLAYAAPVGTEGPDDEIVVLSLGDSVFTRLTDNGASDRNPVWSPDGTQLAWMRIGSDVESGIWTLSVPGGTERLLAGQAYLPDWSWASGGRIAFTRVNPATGVYALWVMTSTGDEQRELPR